MLSEVFFTALLGAPPKLMDFGIWAKHIYATPSGPQAAGTIEPMDDTPGAGLEQAVEAHKRLMDYIQSTPAFPLLEDLASQNNLSSDEAAKHMLWFFGIQGVFGIINFSRSVLAELSRRKEWCEVLKTEIVNAADGVSTLDAIPKELIHKIPLVDYTLKEDVCDSTRHYTLCIHVQFKTLHYHLEGLNIVFVPATYYGHTCILRCVTLKFLNIQMSSCQNAGRIHLLIDT